MSSDKTDFLVSMVAHGSPSQDSAFDVFRVHVQRSPPSKSRLQYKQCAKSPLVLTIYLDQKLENIKPVARMNAIKNLAGFLGLNTVSYVFLYVSYLTLLESFLQWLFIIVLVCTYYSIGGVIGNLISGLVQ